MDVSLNAESQVLFVSCETVDFVFLKKLYVMRRT